MTASDAGLLALRTAIGATVASHGLQKLFGWFGGLGLDETGHQFNRLGFRPGRGNALMAGVTEVGGGAGLALGLATTSSAVCVAGTMAVAASVHWSNGFFSTADGYEFPAVLGAGAAALALTGPGALSLDRMTAGALDQTWLAWLVVPAAIISSSAIMTRRRRSCAESGPGREPVAAPHGAS